MAAMLCFLAAAASRDNDFMGVGAFFMAFSWVGLAGWTFVDAWRRGDAPLAWGMLTLFVGPIGWAVYMVSRRTPPKGCPMCGHPAHHDYLVCPQCGGHLKPRCRSCGRALTAGWLCCPYCATPMAHDPVAVALDDIAEPQVRVPPAYQPPPPVVCPYHAQAATPCAAAQAPRPTHAPPAPPDPPQQ
jgi:hypothetical protein